MYDSILLINVLNSKKKKKKNNFTLLSLRLVVWKSDIYTM